MDRRNLIAVAVAAAVLPGVARARDFESYLAGLRVRAAAAGVPADVIAETTAGLAPNAEVLHLEANQPEFHLSWAQFSSRVLNATRVAEGKAKAAEVGSLLASVVSQYGVSSGPLLGIWGVETNYGKTQGDFSVIDALTTIAWNRNSAFFAGQVISAMKIVAGGYAPAEKLLGSYAGAMGQPQFMPSVYLTTAVSFTGSGQPDIWGNDGDSLASIANYLVKAGWRAGMPSSEPVLAPPGLDIAATGRQNVQTIGYWLGQGVQRLPGGRDLPLGTPAALLLPDGAGGQAFLVYDNFRVIRKYNPSDYYALSVGALGRMILN